jgi:hypothetical protein
VGEGKGPLKVVVHQPQFLPWAGGLYRALSADVYILYCGVKFDHTDHQHRVTLNGSWMTLPIEKSQRSSLIKDVRLAENFRAQTKGMVTRIRQSCMTKRHPHRDKLGPIVDTLEVWESTWMFELNNLLFQAMLKALDIKVEVRVDLTERSGLAKVEKLDTCLKDHLWDRGPFMYLSGAGALDYMGFDSLSTPVETRFQNTHEGVCPDSALQLIASHDQPLEVIGGCAHWMTKQGGRREWNER